jgi:hypothetical protein
MSQDPGNIPAAPDLRQAAAEEYPELRDPAAAAVPGGYSFPPGTPATVPADFAAAQAAAQDAVLADRLTPEEIAEFRALRAEKKKRDQEAAEEAAAAAARLSPPTHHVHLADGRVIEGSPIETHYAEDGGLVAVAGAYAKPEYVTLL